MSRDSDAFDRRTVLKRIGTAATGAATFAASAQARDLEGQYDDRASLLGAFDEHAADLPAALVDAGVVDEEFDFGELDVEFDPELTGMRPTEVDGVAGVTVAYGQGPATALGMISTSTDDHEISLYVQPQRDESYAVVEPADGGDRFVVTDVGDVTTLGCAGWNCTCERCDNPNGAIYYWEEYIECNADCTDCWVQDTSCSCTEIC